MGMFEKEHSTEPVRIYVHVTEGGSTECPPPPKYRFNWPLLLTFADEDNFMISDLEHNCTHITVTSALCGTSFSWVFVSGCRARASSLSSPHNSSAWGMRGTGRVRGDVMRRLGCG